MKKILVVLSIIMVVVGGFTLVGINTGAISSTATHKSETTEIRMENPQTGGVDWIDLRD